MSDKRAEDSRSRAGRVCTVLVVAGLALGVPAACSDEHAPAPWPGVDRESVAPRNEPNHALARLVSEQRGLDTTVIRDIELASETITAGARRGRLGGVGDVLPKESVEEALASWGVSQDVLGTDTVSYTIRLLPTDSGVNAMSPKSTAWGGVSWEGAFWPTRIDAGFALAIRATSGDIWVATLRVPGEMSESPPLVSEIIGLMPAAQRPRCELTWWSSEMFRHEFAAEIPATSAWDSDATVARLWTEAWSVAIQTVSFGRGASVRPRLDLSRDARGHGAESAVAALEYIPEERQLRVYRAGVRLMAQLCGPELMLSEEAALLLLVHEAVHAHDTDRSHALLQALRNTDDPERRRVAEAILEGHADLVAGAVAAARGSTSLWERLVRQRRRGTLAFSRGAGATGDGSQAPGLPRAESAYDLGGRIVTAYLRQYGREGLDALIRDPPARLVDLKAWE